MAKKVVILGAQESGVGAAILAQKHGYQVFLSEYGTINEHYFRELQQYNIPFEQGGHTVEKILEADEIIKSPGIDPKKSPAIQAAMQRGIPILSEIEFAAQHTKAKLIGITGTNGKSTTTALIYHLLKKADFSVGLAGNIGISFARQVAATEHDWYVVELSSFQLDNMYSTHINIAVLCNITPDHLDRYPSLAAYQASKLRIVQNQTPADAFIYNPTDALTADALKSAHIVAQCYPFSLDIEVEKGAFLQNNDNLVAITQGKSFGIKTELVAIKGKHNAYNAMCATLAASLAGVSHDAIAEGLSDFKNLEHRLEFVANYRGAEYINDSKATNIDSAWYALDAMTKPIVWVAGGEEEGNDYSQLDRLVKQNVRAIVCLGADNARILNAYAHLNIPMADTKNMADAIAAAVGFAQSGDVVLLSPACKSYDIFQNYSDRGNQFKAEITKKITETTQ